MTSQAPRDGTDHDVLVVGAGVVGVCTAYEIAKSGASVVVVERCPGPGLDTSFANGGQISVSHAVPWAEPSAPWRVLRWSLQRGSPLLFRPRLELAQLRWLLAWLGECRESRWRENMARLFELASHSQQRLNEIVKAENLEFDRRSNGILHFYRSRRRFEAAVGAAEFARSLGCARSVVDRDRVFAIEPALLERGQDIVGGIFSDTDESGDAHKFTTGLADVCGRLGVEFRYNRLVAGFDLDAATRAIDGVRIRDVATGEISRARARNYVIAAGCYSAPLLRPLGIKLNVYPVKGYSATFPVTCPDRAPNVSLTDEEHKLVYSRLSNRLRVAGLAELNGDDRRIDPARSAVILRQVDRLFGSGVDARRADLWTGLRPATPSNFPYIGRTSCRNLFVNTGHGTLGWTLAAGSAQLLARSIFDGPTAL